MFSSLDHASKFKGFLSSKDLNMNFSIEKDGCLPFYMLSFFVKVGNLQLMFIEERSTLGFNQLYT